MILTNARVILADGIREGLHVVVQHGLIADLTETLPAGDTLDLRGAYLAPGFVDVHVHGAAGRDTMEGTPEAFRAICDFHGAGGTTTLLLTTATAPWREIARLLSQVRRAMGELPQVAGVHVEGPFISRARPGAQLLEFVREPSMAATTALLEYADVIRRVTLAPELPGAIEMIRELTRRGIAVSGGHSDAWDEEAQAGFAAGMRQSTHTFNCMSAARRRGRERVAGLLEFVLSEPEIMCELIADGHHVSPTLMKMLYRAKGTAGVCLVSDATAGAGLENGSAFQLAGRNCVVENGACWLADRSSLAGSAARMIDGVRTMVTSLGVPLVDVITMASQNPARAAGLTNKGIIATGRKADFVVLSDKLEVRRVFIAGEEVAQPAPGTS
jgi:N-acetylglucosamine-6-phosphate deacetylase